MCKAMDDLKEDLEAKGTEKGIIVSVRNLMQTMQISVEQAMDLLLVPKEDRSKYMAKL